MPKQQRPPPTANAKLVHQIACIGPIGQCLKEAMDDLIQQQQQQEQDATTTTTTTTTTATKKRKHRDENDS
eukprot:14740617-Ditylum_brightwellii.AAC.1